MKHDDKNSAIYYDNKEVLPAEMIEEEDNNDHRAFHKKSSNNWYDLFISLP